MQKQNLIAESARKGEILHEILRGIPVRNHGKGLMAGIEMGTKEECSSVVIKARSRGVMGG